MEKIDPDTGNVQHKWHARLAKNILVFLDSTDEGNVVGRVHLQVAMLAPVQRNDKDCDFRMNTGLSELWLRAPTIGYKVQWHNAISDAIRLTSDRRSVMGSEPSELSAIEAVGEYGAGIY